MTMMTAESFMLLLYAALRTDLYKGVILNVLGLTTLVKTSSAAAVSSESEAEFSVKT